MLKWTIIFFSLFQFIASKTIIIKAHPKNFEDNEIKEFKNNPPSHTEHAKMARWLVHNSEWMSIRSISTIPSIAGFPMVNVKAMADSEKEAKSTGIIYFYLTMLDDTAKDLSKNNKLTVLFSMDQSLYCTNKNIDPMEPTCARVMITGKVLKVQKSSKEHDFATKAMISHHPASVNWNEEHNFFLCKIKIAQIMVIDYYGGVKYVKVEDYYKADVE
ncbi:hypothetical protein PVAND_005319 [Polypedilum vanderplanki]|uniref:CREG-like beta-barrel domain-containing protein n=1 Tax=Polypedilum vanderplanki TaxID=319348 RepID=A0A9J6C0R5_POLVA|nr:hypothetical protein PVAND_005319 [Polypedilum vanderplanki]